MNQTRNTVNRSTGQLQTNRNISKANRLTRVVDHDKVEDAKRNHDCGQKEAPLHVDLPEQDTVEVEQNQQEHASG